MWRHGPHGAAPGTHLPQGQREGSRQSQAGESVGLRATGVKAGRQEGLWGVGVTVRERAGGAVGIPTCRTSCQQRTLLQAQAGSRDAPKGATSAGGAMPTQAGRPATGASVVWASVCTKARRQEAKVGSQAPRGAPSYHPAPCAFCKPISKGATAEGEHRSLGGTQSPQIYPDARGGGAVPRGLAWRCGGSLAPVTSQAEQSQLPTGRSTGGSAPLGLLPLAGSVGCVGAPCGHGGWGWAGTHPWGWRHESRAEGRVSQ